VGIRCSRGITQKQEIKVIFEIFLKTQEKCLSPPYFLLKILKNFQKNIRGDEGKKFFERFPPFLESGYATEHYRKISRNNRSVIRTYNRPVVPTRFARSVVLLKMIFTRKTSGRFMKRSEQPVEKNNNLFPTTLNGHPTSKL
jgi:hypothetical protein